MKEERIWDQWKIPKLPGGSIISYITLENKINLIENRNIHSLNLAIPYYIYMYVCVCVYV
jgi:hypothetical protein